MHKYLDRGRKSTFAILFMAGVLIGIIFIIRSKGTLSDYGGLFDVYILYGAGNPAADGRALFSYIFVKRLLNMCFLALLSTTYLGLVCIRFYTVWFGMTIGTYLSAFTARYGMAGFFMAMSGIFPQYLIYIPVLWMLLMWCENLYSCIYIQKIGGQGSLAPKGFWLRNALNLFGLALLLAAGCAVESYVGIAVFTAALSKYVR